MASTIQPTVKIRQAVFPTDKDTISALFLAYEQFILDFASVKLDFQNFAHEVSTLPGKYSVSKNGALYIAYIDIPSSASEFSVEKPIGCVGLRALSPQRSELKRLFLTPESRGLGVGKMLMDVVVERARELGYGEIVLDTLSSMEAARGLYERFGFVEMEAYYESHPDAVFYRLGL